jgi:hypothetical protein
MQLNKKKSNKMNNRSSVFDARGDPGDRK